jgi:hypothetical protein
MRKGNYTVIVKEYMPSDSAFTDILLRNAAFILRLCRNKYIDPVEGVAYLYLQCRTGAPQRDPAKKRPKTRSLGPPRHPQSSTASRTRQPVSHHPFLRPGGFGPGALRNDPTPSGRQTAYHRCGQLVWSHSPNLLQSPKGSSRAWPCRAHTATKGAQNASQAVGRSLGLHRPSSERTPRYHTRPVRRGHWHKIRHRGTPAQLGTRFSKQKKTAPLSVALDPAALLNVYEQVRAVALGAKPACGAGLAIIYRQGIAAWIRSAVPLPITPLHAAQSMPALGRSDVTNELTLILANLVTTLVTENTYA